MAAAWRTALTLAAVIGVTDLIYVAWVGGDFMNARFLIPTTPFLGLAVELALADAVRVSGTRPSLAARAWPALAGVAIALSTPRSRSAIHDFNGVHGIVDERRYYRARREITSAGTEKICASCSVGCRCASRYRAAAPSSATTARRPP